MFIWIVGTLLFAVKLYVHISVTYGYGCLNGTSTAEVALLMVLGEALMVSLLYLCCFSSLAQAKKEIKDEVRGQAMDTGLDFVANRF